MSTTPRTLSPTIMDIIARRQRLGVSQPQLAALAGVSWHALSRTERGLRDLRDFEAAALLLVIERVEQATRDAAALRSTVAL
jgi:predicted transcriptional regulator